jgi:hypothetical protein
MEFGDYLAQSIDPDQQRLTAVQHDLDQVQAMLGRVLGNPLRSSPEHVVRNPLGPSTPALISCLIDVAVIAGQITATFYLKNKLIEREGWSAHTGLRSLDVRLKARLPVPLGQTDPLTRAVGLMGVACEVLQLGAVLGQGRGDVVGLV